MDQAKEDIELIKKLCDIVVYMLSDSRIPLDVKLEYEKQVYNECRFLYIISLDTIEKVTGKII